MNCWTWHIAGLECLTFELTGRTLAHAMPKLLKALRLDELLGANFGEEHGMATD